MDNRDLLWLKLFADSMGRDVDEEMSEEYKKGYSKAMDDVCWGIDFVGAYNKLQEENDMGFFSKSKSGQNPLPTKEQMEKQQERLSKRGTDMYYPKPDQPQTPPIPPTARSFGNEAPPREMRKPPMIDKRTDEYTILNEYKLAFEVPEGFVELYVDVMAEIVRRQTNNYRIEVSNNDIAIKLLVSDKTREVIVKGLEEILHFESDVF